MINDMYYNLKPILKLNPDYIVLHLGTDNAFRNTANELLRKMLALKNLTTTKSKNCEFIISTMNICVDDQLCDSVVSKGN